MEHNDWGRTTHKKYLRKLGKFLVYCEKCVCVCVFGVFQNIVYENQECLRYFAESLMDLMAGEKK